MKGIYIEVEGAQEHWDAPVELVDPSDNSFAVAIGIPNFIQEGDFVVSYSIYDQNNNISEKKSINVSIVDSENRCGSGQSFPRVTGEDGITVNPTSGYDDQLPKPLLSKPAMKLLQMMVLLVMEEVFQFLTIHR